MQPLSIAAFADTADGAAFFRAYDRVLAKWPLGVTRLDLPSKYGTTRVNVCGRPDSPPVILLPGAGATSTVWFENVAALAHRFRVYAVDLLGDPGRSVAHGANLRSTDDLMSWLGAVADGVGLTDFRLAGHSYGAMIALAYALREPRRVRRLVLLDPNACFAGMRVKYLAHAVPLLLRPNEKRQRDFIRWETGGQHVDDDWIDLLACGAEHFPKSKTVVPKRPKRSDLDGLAIDTTVILAARSKVHSSKRVASDIAESGPRLNAVVLEGATHHTMPMSPAAELNALVIDAFALR